MSYRVEIKVVIYADTHQIAESFAAKVETYIDESFTRETAVYSARIEGRFDADWNKADEVRTAEQHHG